MLNRKKYKYQCGKIKEKAKKLYEQNQYEKSLRHVQLLGYMKYNVNEDYHDNELDTLVGKITQNIKPDQLFPKYEEGSRYVVFYDSFGLDTRGLALIYLKALAALNINIIYITIKSRKNRIPSIYEVLSQNTKNRLYFFDDSLTIKSYRKLINFLSNYSVDSLIMYLDPYDLIGIMTGISYESLIKRYLINLTDHAFWLGCNSFDYIIEFRDYGANVSHDYRNIEKNRIIKLPYYPVINTDFKFEGFPIETSNKKIIFSGGSLYKTLGAENKYYQIVEHLLKKHSEVAFIYAGYGDADELDKLSRKYDGRVFHIGERKDLYEMMRHSYLYLSTYPMIGGLMTQYAAAAGTLPMTLLYDDCGTGVLLNPEMAGIEFYDIKDFLNELDKCIEDVSYKNRKEENLKHQLITEKEFISGISDILNYQKTAFSISYSKVDTKNFRKTYLERMTDRKINKLLGKKRFIRYSFSLFPLETMEGILENIKEKLCR